MAIFDLYSKRQKKLRGEMPDVYTYDSIPKKLRVQVSHIITECIGYETDGYVSQPGTAYEFIYNTLCKEYGVFVLVKDVKTHNHRVQLIEFILRSEATEEVLDAIELTFWYLENKIKPEFNVYKIDTSVKLTPDEAIEELNERFKENGVGYSFHSGQIIRIDSTYAHAKITKPALALLSNEKFKGANEEFLKAHEHYRHGRNKECLNECLKAFESTMKTIATGKRWAYKSTDTSKHLIQLCFDNELIPKYLQSQFNSLQNLLESGVPTIRNKESGHGQGTEQQDTNDEITRYTLNLTGSNIIFLIEMSGIK